MCKFGGKYFNKPEKAFVTAVGDELTGLDGALELKLQELLEKTEQVVGSLLQQNEGQK